MQENTGVTGKVKNLWSRGKKWDVRRSHAKLIKKWKQELKRALIEMTWIGGFYYAYKDNFGEKKITIYALEELDRIFEKEQKYNEDMRKEFPNCNPWF